MKQQESIQSAERTNCGGIYSKADNRSGLRV